MLKLHKKLEVRGKTSTLIEHFAPIHRYTRAPYEGKLIRCPHCEATHPVYHFGWAAILCQNCDTWVDKYEWLVDQLDTLKNA